MGPWPECVGFVQLGSSLRECRATPLQGKQGEWSRAFPPRVTQCRQPPCPADRGLCRMPVGQVGRQPPFPKTSPLGQ